MLQPTPAPRCTRCPAADIRSQLAAHLRRLGVPLRSALEGPHRDLLAVRKALASGLFINAARLTDELDVRLSGGRAEHYQGSFLGVSAALAAADFWLRSPGWVPRVLVAWCWAAWVPAVACSIALWNGGNCRQGWCSHPGDCLHNS
jgi:hypothetical protein